MYKYPIVLNDLFIHQTRGSRKSYMMIMHIKFLQENLLKIFFQELSYKLTYFLKYLFWGDIKLSFFLNHRNGHLHSITDKVHHGTEHLYSITNIRHHATEHFVFDYWYYAHHIRIYSTMSRLYACIHWYIRKNNVAINLIQHKFYKIFYYFTASIYQSN